MADAVQAPTTAAGEVMSLDLKSEPQVEQRASLPPRHFYKAAKRALDLTVAAIGTLMLWPLWLLIAAAIKLGSTGPVVFRHVRVGLNGRHYTMLKFRTMVAGAEKMQAQIDDFTTYKFQPLSPPGRDPRITRMGWFLQRSSLDESLQLLNVIKGEMSLVGPRPEVPRIVAMYPPEYHERHFVKPGLAGWAQVNGRSDITYHQKIMYDLEYVLRRSFWFDLKVLLRTVKVVLTGEGAR